MKFTRRNIVGYGLMWLLVIVVVLWADSSAEQHRAEQRITSFEIHLEGGGDKRFVDNVHIDEWLEKHDMHPLGRPIAKVDLAELERVIMEHSAVSSVNVYMTYSGEMVLNVSLRTVVGRLRLAGYDMYMASDGSLMPPVDGYLVSVPIVTGDYKPLFDADYVGNHAHSADALLKGFERHFDDIELRKESLLKRREELKASLRRVEKQSVKRSMFMSDYEYRGRVQSLKEYKSATRKSHAEKDRVIEQELHALEAERLAVTLERQRVYDMIDDFSRLVTFVEAVGNDEFWSAEIVQIELTGGGDSPMQLAIVPRSGNFVVDMGTMDKLDEKLIELRDFYDSTLSNIGWDKYKHISLRYEGQVVCR